MKTRIGQLKAHLSTEIKSLDRDGDIIICDREMPVAVLSPYGKKKEFDEEVFCTLTGKIKLNDLAVDPLDLLMKDRTKR